MRRVASALALSLVLAVPAAALGQARDQPAAEALFERARALVAAKDYAAACPMLAESQRLDPAAGTLLNLADCEEHIGELALAWAHWREAIAALPKSDPALPIAKQRLEKLDPRVPRVTVRLPAGTPAGARVLRDGIELGPGSFDVPLPVKPGAHVITVTAPRRRQWQETVTLLESERREVTVAIGPEVAEPPRVAPPQPSTWSQHKASILVLSGGAVLGAVGLGLAIKTLPDHAAWARACSERQCSAADGGTMRAEALAANVLFGVAGAAAVTSVVVFFTAERAKRPASVEVAPQAAGARVTVRF